MIRKQFKKLLVLMFSIAMIFNVVNFMPGSVVEVMAKTAQEAPTGVSGGLGKINGTTITMEHARTSDAIIWEPCAAGSTWEKGGIFYVRYKETDTQNPSASISVEVTPKAKQEAPTGVSAGAGMINGTTVAMEYSSISEPTIYPCTADSTTVGVGTWYVRYAETETQYAGDLTTVKVTEKTVQEEKEAQEAPTGVSGGLGKINGTTVAMEHARTSDAIIWYPCAAGSTWEKGGMFYVRYKETDTQNPSASISVEVTPKAMQEAPTGLSGGLGMIYGTTVAMEYSSILEPTSYPCTADHTTVGVGTWYVRYVETDTKYAGDSTTVEVMPKAMQEAPTGVSGGLGKIDGTTITMEHARTSDAIIWYPCAAGSTWEKGGIFYVRYKETDTQNPGASISVEVTPKAMQEAPTGLSAGAGMINGTTVAMEYSSISEPTSYPCTADHTTVGVGTWYVRYVETETQYAGESTGVEVTESAEQIIQPSPFTIISGANEIHQINSNGTFTMTCSGALTDLAGIYVDGLLVGVENYTLQSGSTILTFTAEYLNGLSVGTHVVTFIYQTGSAENSFQIIDEKDTVPKTGEKMKISWLLTLMVISGVGVVYFGKKLSRS